MSDVKKIKLMYERAIDLKKNDFLNVFQTNEMLAIKNESLNRIDYCIIEEDEFQDMYVSIYEELELMTFKRYAKRENYTLDETEYFKYLNARTALVIQFTKDLGRQSKLARELKIKPIDIYKLEMNCIQRDVTKIEEIERIIGILKQLKDIMIERLNQFTYISHINQNKIYLYDEMYGSTGQLKMIGNPLYELMFKETKKPQAIIYQNDIMLYKIKKLPKQNISLEVILFLLPEPIKEDDEAPFYPLILGVVNKQNSDVVFADLINDQKGNDQLFLNSFTQLLLDVLKYRPFKIVTHDDEIIELLQHFCRVSDIELIKEKTPQAEKFKQHILSQTIHVESSYITSNEEIDLILKSINQICELITQSSCFCKTLEEKDKAQFKHIIELLHIMMLSQFQEMPACWTPDNFEYVLNHMFPRIFPYERLPLVYEMIREYITVVGEANTMPEYKRFLRRIENPLKLM